MIVGQRFLRRRVIVPLIRQLKQGSTPEKLALSVGLGFAIGCFPIWGTTTLLCLVVGAAFKLNQPALQVANYLAYPLQIALILPLLHLGGAIFTFLPPTAAGTLEGYGFGFLGGVLAWVLFAPSVVVLMHYSSLPILRWAADRRTAAS
ncbi:DUF2062 domain-containing protein [Elusimicrobiota bacterium]